MLGLVEGDTIKATRVQTGNGVDWLLAVLFLDHSERESTVPVALVNESDELVSITDVQGSAIESSTRQAIGPDGRTPFGLTPTSPIIVLPRSEKVIEIPLDPVRASAGHYQGAAFITYDGDVPRQSIKLDLAVRTGPFGPLLLLVLGLLIGSLFKWSSGRGQSIEASLDLADKVRKALSAAREETWSEELENRRRKELDALDERLANVERDILANPDQAKTVLIGISSDLALLRQLSAWSRKNRGHSEDIAWICERIHEGRSDKALERFNNLRDTARIRSRLGVDEVAVDGDEGHSEKRLPSGRPPEPSRATVPGVEDRIAATGLWLLSKGPQILTVIALVIIGFAIAVFVLWILDLIANTQGIAAGIDFFGILLWFGPAVIAAFVILLFLRRAAVIAWVEQDRDRVSVARQLLRVALDVAIVIVGFRLLYLESGSEILGGGITPWIGYFFWGIGADVTSQTLSKVNA
jgi:hypothetical protein